MLVVSQAYAVAIGRSVVPSAYYRRSIRLENHTWAMMSVTTLSTFRALAGQDELAERHLRHLCVCHLLICYVESKNAIKVGRLQANKLAYSERKA